MSKDEIDQQKSGMINDLKDRFRYNSIENEGNDPAMPQEPTDIEESLEKVKTELKDQGGRPREGNTYGKDKHPYGRDPLGNKENESERKRETRTPNSKQLAREIKNKFLPKKQVLKETRSLLDESNLFDDTKI